MGVGNHAEPTGSMDLVQMPVDPVGLPAAAPRDHMPRGYPQG